MRKLREIGNGKGEKDGDGNWRKEMKKYEEDERWEELGGECEDGRDEKEKKWQGKYVDNGRWEIKRD